MEDFVVLSKPYEWRVRMTAGCVWRVRASEYSNLYLHDDRTLHRSVDRVTRSGRTHADFLTEDKAYLAINDYYVMHGEPTPFVRSCSVWYRTEGGGQTTDLIKVMSKPMEFK